MAHIKTYARLKPPKKTNDSYNVNDSLLTIQVPETKDSLLTVGTPLNRSAATYDVRFDDIFKPEATQQEVFDEVASDIIQNFLIGFNGTIFAYGQTGTGKTYTVEGNSCRYESRGLATRSLAMIYEDLEKRTDEHISVYLSFLEIYQEVAYDLLNPGSRTMLPTVPFTKVTVVEGPNGSCVMRGLSLHLAANEDVAQMLLLQGQANRKVAETTVNQRSSRSHAVFSVYLQSRKKDSQIILNSKLHLVDLAGSERVSKTGVDGHQLTEAKSINLSLHHLETVIIVLQAAGSSDQPPNTRGSHSAMSNTSSDTNTIRRSRKHIPYRNSLLTMILKDSLGGNCLTAMIATISLEPENILESLSTCRFAQRVARVANFAKRNEEIDDKMLIKKLKIKVAQLETKLALLLAEPSCNVDRADQVSTTSSLEEVNCQQIVDEFLQGIIQDPVSAGISTQLRFRECLHLMRCRMLVDNTPWSTKKTAAADTSSTSTTPSAPPSQTKMATKKQESVHVAWADKSTELSLKPKSDVSIDSGLQISVSASSTFYTAEDKVVNGASVPHNNQHQTQHHAHQEIKPKPTYGDNSERTESLSQVQQEMDDIDRLLMEATSTSPTKGLNYKTPFERKREQSIKKLGKSLSNIEEEKAAQEQQLELMKQDTVLDSLRMEEDGLKKREQSIKKLGKSLSNIEEEKAAQEQQLELMKQDTILDSLRMEEDGLKLKLQVANEQVADQHAYVLHLKHIESDPELLAQETLVEKQLQKRQTKFQSKLSNVQERRAGVEKELAEMANGKGKTQQDNKSSRTFEDRYGQYRQNKGALNTRQVFEMLKTEEKKQKKEIGKVEWEKTVVKTKQLELKEMATWEKLRELKQMLKMSQRQGEQQEKGSATPSNPNEILGISQRDVPSQNSIMSSRTLSEVYNQSSSVKEVHTNSNVEQTHSDIKQSHSEFISEYIKTVQHKIDAKCLEELNPSPKSVKESDSLSHITTPSLSEHNAGEIQPYSSTDKVFAPVKYPSSELIPHSSHKFRLETDDGSGDVQQNLHEPKVINHGDKRNNNNNSSYDQDFVNHFHTNGGTSTNSPSGIFPSWSAHQLSLKETVNQSQPKQDPALVASGPTGYNKANVNGFNSDIINSTDKLNSSSTIEDFMEMLTPSTIQSPHSNNNDINQHENSPIFSNHKILPPSEYINSMTEQERFDARKMGLSSRTFESALSHMLDDPSSDGGRYNVPDLPYSVDVYESYTRNPLSPTRPQKTRPYQNNKKHRSYNKKISSSTSSSHNSTDFPKGSSNRSGSKNKKSQPSASEQLDKVLDEQSTWGPNVKNVSIADRLSGLFDDTPSDFLPSQNTAKQNKKSGHRNERPTNLQNSQSDFKLKNGLLLDLEEEEEGGLEVEGVLVDKSCNEEDLFFGNQTPRTAITAVKKEEGERTFMSRVASERERIAKIRKARHAAEVIQKHWRKLKTK